MFSYDNFITVRGGVAGKTFTQSLEDGRVTMSGIDKRGVPFKHIVLYHNGHIADRKVIQNGKTVLHTVYGSFEKKGDNIVRFRKGTKCGKHGKARTFEKLFGKEGVCHSWYSHGRLIKQKFIYDSGVTAYKFTLKKAPVVVKDYNGNEMLTITRGKLVSSLGNASDGFHSVLNGSMGSWFSVTEPFQVVKKGKVIFQGQHEVSDSDWNRAQRSGEWVEDGLTSVYVRGVAMPKTLQNIPVDKIPITKVLTIKNAQLRMALMSKFEPEKIAKCGTIVHKEGDMALFDIKGFEARVLKVKCPSTGSLYYLQVPKDSKECEQARQWTFGVGEMFDKPIVFEKET